MREILFRGKDKISGKWIYGDLIKSNEKYYIHPQGNAVEVDKFIGNKIVMREVTAETVGQYIGFKDIDDKEVFEGDILQHIVHKDKYSILYDKDEYGYFLYKGDNSYCISIDGFYPYNENESDVILEVISNIYDNPELLEEA